MDQALHSGIFITAIPDADSLEQKLQSESMTEKAKECQQKGFVACTIEGAYYNSAEPIDNWIDAANHAANGGAYLHKKISRRAFVHR